MGRTMAFLFDDSEDSRAMESLLEYWAQGVKITKAPLAEHQSRPYAPRFSKPTIVYQGRDYQGLGRLKEAMWVTHELF